MAEAIHFFKNVLIIGHSLVPRLGVEPSSLVAFKYNLASKLGMFDDKM